MSPLPLPLPWKWNECKSNFSGEILVCSCSSNQAAQLGTHWTGWHWWSRAGHAVEHHLQKQQKVPQAFVGQLSAAAQFFKGIEGQWLRITNCKCSHCQGAGKAAWRAGKSSGTSGQESGCRQSLPEAVPFSPFLLWLAEGQTRGAQSRGQSYDTFKKYFKMRTCKSAGQIYFKIFLSSCNDVSWIV